MAETVGWCGAVGIRNQIWVWRRHSSNRFSGSIGSSFSCCSISVLIVAGDPPATHTHTHGERLREREDGDKRKGAIQRTTSSPNFTPCFRRLVSDNYSTSGSFFHLLRVRVPFPVNLHVMSRTTVKISC